MKYTKFTIENYRAIKNPIEINVKKNKLIPLIGANECGKTTILHAIYAFDYANDNENGGRHLQEIRNLYDAKNENDAIISATISVKKKDFLNALNEELRQKYDDLDNFDEIVISRNLTTKDYTVSIIDDKDDSKLIAREIVSRLPYIIYNDDFIERPKNEIDIPNDSDDLSGWKGIYERVFRETGYSIYNIAQEPENIRLTKLSEVEDLINKTLVKEWAKISIDNGKCLSIKLSVLEGNKLSIKITEKILNKDKYFNIEDRSKGFLWFFNFVMKIKFNPKSSGSANDIIYLLDEPGSYLHPSAQEKLCDMIKGISNKDGTVIYCTHTHHLLDPKFIPPKFIYLVQKDSSKIIHLTRINELKTFTKRESELQPVYEALGVCDWDYFSQTQKVIAVEGIYDKYAIELFTSLRGNSEYVIMPCSNAEAAYNQIPKFIAYGKKYAVLWDNDDEGQKYCNKAKTTFKKLEEHKFLVLPNNRGKKKVRMEEMFENNDISKLAEFLGLNKNASYENVLVSLVASSEAQIKKSKEVLSNETLENFDQLLNNIEYVFKGKIRIKIDNKELVMHK